MMNGSVGTVLPSEDHRGVLQNAIENLHLTRFSISPYKIIKFSKA